LSFRSDRPQALTGYVQPYCKSAVGASFLLLQGGGHPQIDSAAGRRICPRWLSTCTGTGRLSCRGPNLQALPRNAEKAGITMAEPGAEDEEEDDAELIEVDAEGKPIVGAGAAPAASAAGASSSAAPPAARAMTLKNLVRMRDMIVPTPAPLAAAIRAHGSARWNAEQRCVEIPADAIAELAARPQEEQGEMAAAGPMSSADAQSTAPSAGGSLSLVHEQPLFLTFLSGLLAPGSAAASLAQQLQSAGKGERRVLMCADYNQMEVRLLAQLCQDEGLIQSFVPESAPPAEPAAAAAAAPVAAASSSSSSSFAPDATAPAAAAALDASAGSDVYRSMAAQIFHGGDVARVTDAQRVIAKTIVLGSV
jgi:hypothetical protein